MAIVKSTQTAITPATRLVHGWLATNTLRCGTKDHFTRSGRLVTESVSCPECLATFKK